MLKQPDYLGDVGRGPRVAAAVVLGALALLFGLMALGSAVGAVAIAAKGEWDIAPVVAGSGAGCGLLAALLVWMTRRVLRGGGAAGRPAVFPLWFIQLVGLMLLPGAVLGSVQAINNGGAGVGLRAVALTVGPPVAMILVPWLVRRRARRTEVTPTEAPVSGGKPG